MSLDEKRPGKIPRSFSFFGGETNSWCGPNDSTLAESAIKGAFMSDEVFEKPKSIFQQRVNEIVSDDPTRNVVLDIFQLELYKNAEKSEDSLVFVELYNLLGAEKFCDVIGLLSGKTVKFPTQESVKEDVTIALCYYYKRFRNKSWDEIKELMEDDRLQSVKYGIKLQQLNKFIKYVGDRTNARYSLPPVDEEFFDGQER